MAGWSLLKWAPRYGRSSACIAWEHSTHSRRRSDQKTARVCSNEPRHGTMGRWSTSNASLSHRTKRRPRAGRFSVCKARRLLSGLKALEARHTLLPNVGAAACARPAFVAWIILGEAVLSNKRRNNKLRVASITQGQAKQHAWPTGYLARDFRYQHEIFTGDG